MAKKTNIIICLLVLSFVLLQGCLFYDVPVDVTTEQDSPEVQITQPADVPNRPASEPGIFTIRYDPDNSVNPITSLSMDNIVISSLLYEPLFTLDGNLGVKQVLCDSWSTEDFSTYVIGLKDGIVMSDGSILTADDVVYTIRQAMLVGRFVNRLRCIRSIDSHDDLEITIILNSPNKHFIRLLDIPIIKLGSIEDSIPPGTGSYVFDNSGAAQLVRFSEHRDFWKLNLETVQLLVCNDNEMAELFDSGVLSLLWDDPSDTFNIILNRHNEARYYETTTLQYLGFNARSVILRDSYVRRAIGSSLNRQNIIEQATAGQSVASSLAFSPTYWLYSSQWEKLVVDPLIEMSDLFYQAGLEDFDSDSYLEYPDSFGGYYEISLDFIVNTENTYKVRAAHMIADTLRLYGIEIIVRELPWNGFQEALASGSFDVYFGEIALGADFDLSPLLLPDSQHNYGLTGSESYRPFIEAYLSAESDEDESIAAANLCETIRLNAPFIPILYKKYVVFTPIGAVSGAEPSQSGVFNGFPDWTVNLEMIP